MAQSGNSPASFENPGLRRLAHRVVDQRLAERPDRAGHLVAAGDHVVERLLDPAAVFLGDHQRRQQLDGVEAVAGDLRENLVILEQRHRDELAEQGLEKHFFRLPLSTWQFINYCSGSSLENHLLSCLVRERVRVLPLRMPINFDGDC